MFPHSPLEILVFLFVIQNLPRAITVDQCGTELVKVNSTSIKILYPKGLPKLDFLILSMFFLLLRLPHQVK